MMIVLWLAEFLGIEGIKKLSLGVVKWTVRLFLWAVLLIVLAVVGWKFLHDPEASATALFITLTIAALWLAWVVFRALWHRLNRKSVVAEIGERTIDGKVVPDKLAVAALGVPPRSPDGEYVFRGLPDYGKALLRLPLENCEYIPDAPGLELAAPQLQAVSERPKLSRGQKFSRQALMVVGIWAVAFAGKFVLDGGFKQPVQQAPSAVAPPEKPSPDNAELKPAPPQEKHVQALEQQQATPDAPVLPDHLTATPPATATASPAPATGRESFSAIAQKFLGKEADTALWRDPETGNVWTLRDNGKDVNWEQGEAYCKSLSGGRFALPTLHDLQGIVSPNGVFKGGVWSNKGDSLFLWTRELSDKDFSGTSQYFVFFRKTGNFEPNPYTDRNGRAICVAAP